MRLPIIAIISLDPNAAEVLFNQGFDIAPQTQKNWSAIPIEPLYRMQINSQEELDLISMLGGNSIVDMFYLSND